MSKCNFFPKEILVLDYTKYELSIRKKVNQISDVIENHLFFKKIKNANCLLYQSEAHILLNQEPIFFKKQFYIFTNSLFLPIS